MKKSEIAKGLDVKATTIFIATAVALVANSLINNLTRLPDISAVAETVGAAFVVLTSLFSYVMLVRGFAAVDKACKLCEKNENYYMGKNLTVFSVVCIIMGVILSIAALIFSVFISKYNAAEGLTPSDLQARNNVVVITALINIAMQFFSISTPFIFYLWRIHKVTPKSDKINTFALLAMVIMIVHLAIGVLNSIYTVKGSANSFLPDFSSILNTVKYLVLLLFFFTRKKSLLADKKEIVGEAK